MSKLLPPIFADAMAENAQSAVTLFEGTHENPELIWSEEIRSSTSLYISRTARDLASQQRCIFVYSLYKIKMNSHPTTKYVERQICKIS